MRKNKFVLKSFQEGGVFYNFELLGNVSRENGTININYEIKGDLSNIKIPEKGKKDRRKDNLWSTTCFEFFISVKGSTKYWEFNLAPSGNWNVYFFEDYRKGMREELSFNKLPFIVKNKVNSLLLNAKCNIGEIIGEHENIDIGVSAIIESKNSNLCYWALSHPKDKPDFHDKKTFLITL